MQLRGRGKEGLVHRLLHQDELLADAHGDGVIADGSDREERRHDQPVDVKDHLHGGLVDEFHRSEAEQLGKRRPIKPGTKMDPGHQAASNQREDHERDDVDRDRHKSQSTQPVAQFDRDDLRQRGGGAKRQGPAGEEIEPLQSLRHRHEQQQHHVAGEAGSGNVQHEARIGPQPRGHMQHRIDHHRRDEREHAAHNHRQNNQQAERGANDRLQARDVAQRMMDGDRADHRGRHAEIQ